MSDLISREAAVEAFRKELCREREYITGFKGCERVLNELPAVEPIVWCKDCVNFHKYGFKLEYTECKHFDCDVCEDGFCAWGERKEVVE